MVKDFFRLTCGGGWVQPTIIAFLMIVMSVAESVGIGMLLPIINTIQNPDIIWDNKYLHWLYTFFGTKKVESFSILLLILFVIFFLIKNGLSIFLSFIQMRFTMQSSARMSSSLLGHYLAAPYLRHLKKDSADLMILMHEMVTQTYNNFVLPIITLVTDILAILAIILLLFLVEPKVTALTAIAIIGCILVFYLCFRDRFQHYGEENIRVSKAALGALRDALSSVKEAKVYRAEANFSGVYKNLQEENADLVVAVNTVHLIPRSLIEIAAIVALASMIIATLLQGRPPQEMLSVLSLFAMAALRLLPAANRILHNLNKVRFSMPHVAEVLQEHETLKIYEIENKESSNPKEKTASSVGIVGKNLTFAYPNASSSVFENISFEIKSGEVVGFAGPSGAGKSTLGDIILGLMPPDQGDITAYVDGTSVPIPKNIGYVPQRIHLLNKTLRENIAFGVPLQHIDDKAVLHAAQLSRLHDVIDELPQGLWTMMGEEGSRLSGGQRQRVAIARALYVDPQVLIMDEATSALDNETENEISKAITGLAGKKTVIIIAHRLSTLRQCQRLFFLSGGKIKSVGTFQSLEQSDREFRNMILSGET